ncbi:MAG: tripartite tricarboxylate transporter substrate binding protein [Betaproteobacteria bacterium]|nr:tripartite tricarboxylate transporter substrate binding protein [Betaproteobacteria bacterium]
MTPAWRPHSEVELIVGTPPGGGQDRPARALMRVLQARGLIDVPMRLTNIPGKGGGKAWDALRQHPRDPHVLSISSAPLITNRLLGVSDFDHTALTPIATLYTEYLAFVVRSDSPLRSGADLLDRLRSNAGELTIAIATAVGTTNHIALGQIVRHLGGDPKGLKLRVFDSALYAVADVVEGNADAGAISAVSAVKALETGGLRALSVSAPRRMGGLFASVPTWAEQAVPCTIGQWRGIIGAPGITREQIAYWEQALAAATASPEWAAELEQHYWTNTYRASEETRAFLDSERVFLSGMLRELGLIG